MRFSSHVALGYRREARVGACRAGNFDCNSEFDSATIRPSRYPFEPGQLFAGSKLEFLGGSGGHQRSLSGYRPARVALFDEFADYGLAFAFEPTRSAAHLDRSRVFFCSYPAVKGARVDRGVA